MKKGSKFLSLLLSCIIAIGSVSFAGISVSANAPNILFDETFEEGYAEKTTYNGKTGAWSTSDGNGLLWNNDGGEGKIYENKKEAGGMQFILADGQEYTDAMVLEVTADVLAGEINSSDYGRVDIIGSIESDGHHRITLCSFSGGKIYANTMSTATSRDTGATYEAGKRYIVKGIIDEANETFTLSVYDKETGNAILENYNVTPYKHDKSNWQKMTAGFKGVNFYANRTGSGSPAYSLYSLRVKKVVDPWNLEQSNITLTDDKGENQSWDAVKTSLSTVAIDFGEAMYEPTLTDDNIYMVNNKTDERVACTGNYADNVYTLTVNEELWINNTYSIIVKSNVLSATGGEITEDKVFQFKTARNILFEETFDADYDKKTEYNGKTGAWSASDGNGLLQNSNDNEGKIYENRNEVGGMQFKFNDGQEYTEAMVLKVEADILTGPVDKTDYARVDIIGSIDEAGKHHRISLCSFSGGKIYANTTNNNASYDTGATYEANKRYIVKGIIDEANETFTLSVYDKETGNAVLENYNVTPYKHEKSNWLEMTAGFKGVCFYANRSQSGSPAYSLYSLSVEKVVDAWEVEESDVYLSDGTGVDQAWDDIATEPLTVTIDFGEPMDRTTLTNDTVYIENAVTGEKVACSGSYANYVYTLTADEKLLPATDYNLVLTTGIVSAEGGKRAENIVFEFTTFVEVEGGIILFEETFEEGFADKTRYNGKTGVWSNSESAQPELLWNYNDGEGKIYADRNKVGGMQFILGNGQEYTDAMVLEVTADILAGDPTKTDYCRVDIIGSIENGNHHRISLCSFSGGKIYANCLSTATARDTGATYEAGKRYIVKGTIDEINKKFTLSVYEKDTGNVVLGNYNVTPYKHDKSNWYEIKAGFKGINFYANRAGNGSPAYSLYSLTVEEVVSKVTSFSVKEQNGYTATSVFYNMNRVDEDAVMIIAQYTNENELVGFDTKEITALKNVKSAQVFDYSVEKKPTAQKCKAFIWKSVTGLDPLFSRVSLGE